MRASSNDIRLRGNTKSSSSIVSSGDSVRIYAYVAMGVRQKMSMEE